MTEVVYGLGAGERERVAALRAQQRFFWIDVSLGDTSHDDLVQALGTPESALRALPRSGEASASRTFHAHREAVVFALRCYLEPETRVGERAFRLRPFDVQFVVTGEYLLTLHEARVSPPDVLSPDLPGERSKNYVVYSVLEAILVTSFDALDEVEVMLDALAVSWTDEAGGRVPKAAAARLATMRRWVGAEQTVFERVAVEIRALRGFETDDEPYFERLDEQVNRLAGSIDAAANGLGMLFDLQLNERAYVVSVVATIFVPLTFVTGYFGMNFGWLVDRIHSPIAFWLLGFVVPIAAGLLSWRLLVRRFVIGDRG